MFRQESYMFCVKFLTGLQTYQMDIRQLVEIMILIYKILYQIYN
jgi:hypothetical protein